MRKTVNHVLKLLDRGTRRRPEHLHTKLLAIRRKLELSQSQMAYRIGQNVSGACVSEYENGIREPNLLVLLAYAKIAGVSMDVIVNDRLSLPEN